MSVPTRGETYAKLIEHLRLAQEDCSMMAHLVGLEGTHVDQILVKGWLGIEELLKKMTHQVTKLAQGRLQ